MLKLTSLLSMGLIATLAHSADFSGQWSGPGKMLMKNPFTGTQESPCSKISIAISQPSPKLKIERYQATCGMMAPEWGPREFEIRGEKVWESDEDGEFSEVGTLQNGLLKTLSSGGSAKKAFNLRINDNGTLDSYYGVQNGSGSIVIEGNLSKSVE